MSVYWTAEMVSSVGRGDAVICNDALRYRYKCVHLQWNEIDIDN